MVLGGSIPPPGTTVSIPVGGVTNHEINRAASIIRCRLTSHQSWVLSAHLELLSYRAIYYWWLDDYEPEEPHETNTRD